MPDGEAGGFDTRAEAELVVDRLQVAADGAWADEELLGDLGVGVAKVEANGGEVCHIGPGIFMQTEDITSSGHNTRGVGDVERLTLFILLPD